MARVQDAPYLNLAADLIDDTYYYFLPAIQFREFGYFTFDRLHPTYGFQPLWELCLVALGYVVHEREAFLRAALIACIVLRALTGFLVFRLGTALRDDAMASARGLLAAALFLGNPPYARVAGGGKEGSLYVLLAVAGLLLVFRRPARLGTPRGAASFGVLLSALLLTRLTPISLLLAALLAYWGSPHLGPPGRLPFAVGFGFPVATWGAYAYGAFGRVFPTSGAIKLAPTLALLRDESLATLARGVWIVVREYAVEILSFAAGVSSRFEVMPESLLTWVVALGTVGAVLRVVGRAAETRRGGRELVLLAVSAAGTLLVPVLLLGQGQNVFYYSWYLNELPLALSLVAASAVPDLAAPRVRGLATAAAAVLLVGRAWTAAGEVPKLASGPHFPAVVLEGVRAAQELAVTEETRIAAFDAGLLGWLLPSHVINLDGLANDDRYRAERRGVSDQRYVHERGVEYVINGIKPWFAQRGTIIRSFPLHAVAPPGPYVVVRLAAEAPCHEGFQDVTNCDVVAGWAWDCARREAPVTVEVVDGRGVVASMVAGMPREDLARGLGSANHGFLIPLPAARGRRVLQARVQGSSVPLSGGPVELDCQ